MQTSMCWDVYREHILYKEIQVISEKIWRKGNYDVHGDHIAMFSVVTVLLCNPSSLIFYQNLFQHVLQSFLFQCSPCPAES